MVCLLLNCKHSEKVTNGIWGVPSFFLDECGSQIYLSKAAPRQGRQSKFAHSLTGKRNM